MFLTFKPECVTVILDASWVPMGNTFLSKLACWVFPSGGSPFGRVILFPPSFVRLLQPRDFSEFLELFEHNAVTFHSDNTSALMVLIKGSSWPLILPISRCPLMLAVPCSKLSLGSSMSARVRPVLFRSSAGCWKAKRREGCNGRVRWVARLDGYRFDSGRARHLCVYLTKAVQT